MNQEKKFFQRILIFVLPVLCVLSIMLFLPPTPREKESLLYAKHQKDSLLQNTRKPRIIFVGGSNLSFGLHSQIINDSLKLFPINTAIHASLGLKYIMESTLKYIIKDDVIVLAPEYSHFYGTNMYGREELLRTVLGVNSEDLSLLNFKQIYEITPYLFKYSSKKLDIREYYGFKRSDVYGVDVFNKYGDVYTHWELKAKDFKPYPSITKEYNPDALATIIQYNKIIRDKGAKLVISYPCIQETSFNNMRENIKYIEKSLKKTGLPIVGTPERYKFSDSLMFDTPYHLHKEGGRLRTLKLIEDLRPVLEYVN